MWTRPLAVLAASSGRARHGGASIAALWQSPDSAWHVNVGLHVASAAVVRHLTSCGCRLYTPAPRLRIAHGSVEVNPPFVPSLITATALHLLRLLGAAEAGGRALSFAVLLPCWTDVPGWCLLRASTFLTCHVLLPAADHGAVPRHPTTTACDATGLSLLFIDHSSFI
jgi:Phosphorylated CTD interacting factor 1 WW domain